MDTSLAEEVQQTMATLAPNRFFFMSPYRSFTTSGCFARFDEPAVNGDSPDSPFQQKLAALFADAKAQGIKNPVLFRLDFLYNADQRVRDDDRQKRKIPERTGKDQKDGNNQKNQVEIRTDIALYDLGRCLGRRFHRAVGPAVLAVLGNLLGGKAFGRVCLIARRWNTAVNDFGNCFVHNSYIPLRLS